jgi:uncharacterized protein YuzE
MQIRFDTEADALYVQLTEPRGQVGTRVLDDLRFVDYDEDDSVVGVEFIQVSRGIKLDGVPRPDEIGRALHSLVPA